MSLESEITDTITVGVIGNHSAWEIRNAILALPEMVEMREWCNAYHSLVADRRKAGWLHRDDKEYKELQNRAERAEAALAIISMWAKSHWERWYELESLVHKEALKDIHDKALEGLGRKYDDTKSK